MTNAEDLKRYPHSEELRRHWQDGPAPALPGERRLQAEMADPPADAAAVAITLLPYWRALREQRRADDNALQDLRCQGAGVGDPEDPRPRRCRRRTAPPSAARSPRCSRRA